MNKKRPTKKRATERRSNVERSATTRAKLIAAAIACIRQVGLAAASTTMIACKARVSRGAMLHQFPQLTDLLFAVAEHIVQARAAELMARAADMTPRERFWAAADTSWDIENQPSTIVLREILTATISDRRLHRRLQPLIQEMTRLRRRGAELMAEDLGIADVERVYALVEMHMATLYGLSMAKLFGHDAGAIERARELFTALEREFGDRLVAAAQSDARQVLGI